MSAKSSSIFNSKQQSEKRKASPRSINELKKFKVDNKGLLCTPKHPMPPKTPAVAITAASSPTKSAPQKARQTESSELELFCEICNKKYNEQKRLPIVVSFFQIFILMTFILLFKCVHAFLILIDTGL